MNNICIDCDHSVEEYVRSVRGNIICMHIEGCDYNFRTGNYGSYDRCGCWNSLSILTEEEEATRHALQNLGVTII